MTEKTVDRSNDQAYVSIEFDTFSIDDELAPLGCWTRGDWEKASPEERRAVIREHARELLDELLYNDDYRYHIEFVSAEED